MDDMSMYDKSCLDASMISCTDTSLINERESESMTEALDSTRLFQSTQTLLGGGKAADSNSMFKIEATLDDEITPCNIEAQTQPPFLKIPKSQKL